MKRAFGTIAGVRPESIDGGADVNAKDDDGHTPLDAAIALNREIADLLRKNGGKTGEELKAEGK